MKGPKTSILLWNVISIQTENTFVITKLWKL